MIERSYSPDARSGDTLAAIQRFRSLCVAVVGDLMLDTYLEGTASRLCREGPVPVVRRKNIHRAPGGAANTAANLSAMGADVRLIGLIGQDEAGEHLRRELRRRGVSGRWLVSDAGLTTLHKLRVIANEQYVVRFDDGETRGAGNVSRAALEQQLRRACDGCDVIVVSDYDYGVISDMMLSRIAKLRDGRHVPLVVDSKKPERFRRLQPTMLTPSHTEVQLVIEPSSISEPALPLDRVDEMGHKLREMVGAESVAITLSDRGAYLIDGLGDGVQIPAYPVTRACDIGAGDSFTAAIALGLAAGLAPVDAARLSVTASGIAVGKRRTAVVSHQELLQRASLAGYQAEGANYAGMIDEVVGLIAEHRQAGHTVVFTNGIFDILHAGHISFLRQARQLGDVLVVGVNSDRSVRHLTGNHGPQNSERDRLALASALEPVDHAVLFDAPTPADLIRKLRPDIHAKGGDYEGQALPEAEAVHDVGGKVVILPLTGEQTALDTLTQVIAPNGRAGVTA